MKVIYSRRVIASLSLLLCSAASAQVTTERPHILGVCELVELRGSGQADLYPTLNANRYFHVGGKAYPKPYIPEIDEFGTAKIIVLQQPKHGRVEPSNSDGDWTRSRYRTNDGYLGNDSFVMQVEGNGYKVTLHYFMYVTDGIGETFFENKACAADVWKISTSSPEGALVQLVLRNVRAE